MVQTPCLYCMGYQLVKLGTDSFTIHGDTEFDRQTGGRTDGHTQDDRNRSAGL